MLKRHFAFLALAIAALALIGCDDSPENGRAIVAVSEINNGNPVQSSVSTGTSDIVPMEFRWRPYNEYALVSEATPHGDILIESYTISWTLDGGTSAIPSRTEVTSIFVPVYDVVSAGILMVTAEEKAAVVGVPVSLIAHIDFKAREMGTEHEIEFSTQTSVTFIN